MTRSRPTPFPDPRKSAEVADLTGAARADDLLRHAAWLHALARTLVGEADADDVVQETWVAAIAKRPRGLASLRAWLGAVARNVVRQGARAQARRSEREREVATSRGECEPSVDAVVARADRMRELVERVLALDEPFRTTILLRFFEGVKPQEIARRVGASDEAVRQRLKRGLDRLREGLDKDHGGDRESWIAGLAPLLGAPAGAIPAAAAATASKGLVAKGILMNAPAKFAIAAAVVIVVGAAAFFFDRSGGSSSSSHSATRPTPDPSLVSDVAVKPTAARTAAALGADGSSTTSRRPDATVLANSNELVPFVYGAVVDERGEVVEDVPFEVSPATNGESDHRTKTAAIQGRSWNGTWSFAGLAPGAWHVSAKHDGFVPCERDFVIEAGVEAHRADLVLKKSLAIPIRFIAPDGTPLAEVMKEERDRARLRDISVVGFSAQPPARFEVSFDAVSGLSGNGSWFARSGTPFSRYAPNERVAVPDGADGVLIPASDPPEFIAAMLSHLTLACARVGDPSQRIDLIVDPARIRAGFATLHLRVVDAESKRPIEGTRIGLSYGHTMTPEAARSDRDGRVTLARLMPGPLALELNALGRQRLSLYVGAEAGADLDLGTIELSLPVKLHGHVMRSDGRAVEGSTSFIELDHWRHGQPAGSSSGYGVARDGCFDVEDLGRGRYLVVVNERDCATTTMALDTRAEPLPTFELELVPGTPVNFEMEKPLPLQSPVFEIDTADGELVSSARGLWSDRLRRGRYRLSAWRGEVRVLELPFEVGDAPVTVRVPRIADPNGLTWAEPSPAARESASSGTAPKIVGDPIGVVCYGRVVDGEGRGLEEGGVSFATGRNTHGSSILHGGCFAAAGLAAGRIERQFFSSSILPFVDWIDLASGPTLQRRDFHVAPGTRITIDLVDAATGESIDRVPDGVRTDLAIPGFAVIATKEPPPPDVPVVDPDWNYYVAFGAGRFQWENPTDFRKRGDLEVIDPLPVFVSLVSGGHVLHTQFVAAPVANLKFAVDWNAVKATLAGVRFRLVDATTGESLAATLIEFLQMSMGSAGGESKVLLPFDSADGYLRTGLPPGEHKLVVLVAGHESLEHEIVLPAGQITDLGTIELGAPRCAKGRVVDAQGHPLKVTIKMLDGERAHRPVPLRQIVYNSSDENGSFSVGASHGRAELLIEDPRFAATCLEVDASTEPIDDLRIVLVPGIPVSLHLRPDDVSREEFTVEDHDGHLVATRTMTMGSCRLNLRPGKYTAAVVVNGEQVASDDFEVKDLPVEVALER